MLSKLLSRIRPRTALIATGLFTRKDGERLVALEIDGARCLMTPDGARLAAKNLTEWADHADKIGFADTQREMAIGSLRRFVIKLAQDTNGTWQVAETQPAE